MYCCVYFSISDLPLISSLWVLHESKSAALQTYFNKMGRGISKYHKREPSSNWRFHSGTTLSLNRLELKTYDCRASYVEVINTVHWEHNTLFTKLIKTELPWTIDFGCCESIFFTFFRHLRIVGEIIRCMAPPTFNMSRGLISRNNLRHLCGCLYPLQQTHPSNEIYAHVGKNHLPT